MPVEHIVLWGEEGRNGGTRWIASGKGKRTLLAISGEGNKEELPGTRKKTWMITFLLGLYLLHWNQQKG